jgi:hypothetical protein
MREALNAAGPQGRPVIRKLGSLDWAAAALGATSSGVALNVIAHGTPGKLLKGFEAASYHSHLASTTVPQDALLYYTFHGWGSAKGIAPIFGAAQLGPFRTLLGQVGKLIAGENALYVRPASGRIPEITLVTEPARGTNGAASLDHLLLRFRKDLHAAPRRTEIAGLPARTLSFGSFAINYANVGNKLVVTDLPAGIRGVQSGPKLAQNANYRDALESAGVPAKTPGYLYVNIHSTIPLVERLSHARIPGEIRRNLTPLRSALEYEVARSHEVEVSFFLRIR